MAQRFWFPRNVKPTKAVAHGIKQYLKKAGYRITEINEPWDLKGDKIPMGNAGVLIGGNIEELEITCRKGNLTNSYKTHMTLAVVIADAARGRILYRTRVKSIYTQEHVLFSENILGQQADMVLSDAIEKLLRIKKWRRRLRKQPPIKTNLKGRRILRFNNDLDGVPSVNDQLKPFDDIR